MAMFGLLPDKDDSDTNEDVPVSDYDGQPLRQYQGRVNGRVVTVYSSWKPGDPDR